jgi:thioredoxin-dependent peroxiredoxin
MRALPLLLLFACAAQSPPPKAGDPAPQLAGPLESGAPFDLKTRTGEWTVLYFYPKDGTPGCTKQACAFRDATKVIEKQGAKVYGISRDSVLRHQDFIKEHKLSFSLVADEDGTITRAWGVSGMLGMSKRWTFIVDPNLVVRAVQEDVDPALNASAVAESLLKLQAKAD